MGRYRRAPVIALVVLLLAPITGVRAAPSIGDDPRTTSVPWFDTTGAHLGAMTLRLAAFGRGADSTMLAPAPAEDDGTRVQYRHGDVTEWYLRQGAGIEQGMTLSERPAGDGPLVLEVATPGVVPVVDADGLGATLLLPLASGIARWRYIDLRVTDATGQAVPVHLDAAAGGVAIVVEDREAAYPLVVDPYMLQQTIANPEPGVNGGGFGIATALSSDGSTLVVGADPSSTTLYAGRAYIYTRSGGSYSASLTLADPDATNNDEFGTAVAVSADGSIVAVGAFNDHLGKAYIYTKSGATWSLANSLSAPMSAFTFGKAVSVSGDGSVVAVGAPQTNGTGGVSLAGTAYVYVNSGSGFPAMPTQSLADPANMNVDGFGSALALSGDGSTLAIVSASRQYVFAKSGGSYHTLQIVTLPNSDGSNAVAVSGDGNTLVFGVDSANVEQGAVYTYARTSGYYSLLATLTEAMSAGYYDLFGIAVAVSTDGATVVVGAEGTNSNKGQAYVFTKSGGSYGTPTTLTESMPASRHYFGTSVAVSGDGVTVAVGAPPPSGGGTVSIFGIPATAPIAANHQYEIAINTPLVVAAPTGLLSGSSLGFPPATITAHSTPGHGAVSINADGSFTYTPAMGYSGTDSFTYTLSNSAGMSTGTVTITVVNGVVSPKPGTHTSGAVSGTTPRTQPMGHVSGTTSGSTPLPQPPRH